MDSNKLTVPPISAPLVRLAREAVGRALSARHGEEPFITFSIWDTTDGQGGMLAYATDTSDEAISTPG